jgi:tetratricopeptide (TPR) repeat protein
MALLPTLDEVADEDERKGWRQRGAMVLAQAGRTEEALAWLRSLAASNDARLSDWGNLATQYTKLKQFSQAREVLEEAALWAAERRATDGQMAGAAVDDAAYLAHLQCIVALASGQYEQGIAHFEQAAQLDKTYKERPYLLYARLIFYNQLEPALKYIQRDSKHPVRAGLWYGVVQKRLGKPAEARRQWEGVIKALTPQTDDEQFVELVLSFYYLGDPDGRGLGGVLRSLQSGGSQSWVLLFLAGLGWMLRGNVKSARTNFALAVARRKANAEGVKLSAEVWQHCQDLLSEEQQAQIIEYFTTDL